MRHIKKAIKNNFITKFVLSFIEQHLHMYWNPTPPGHYYSPIPARKDIDDFFNHSDEFAGDLDLQGIDLRSSEQTSLLKQISQFCSSHPYQDEKQDHLKYYFNNGYFKQLDAVLYHGLLRHLKPDKIVEIGSGFSSAVALDANDRYLDGAMSLTFIEPYADRLKSLLSENDKVTVLESKVQDIDLEVFSQLKEGDILFIDSSHVAKIGSDVTFIFSKILPRIKKGVFIHFHDIFWPFEYPKDWFTDHHICWNEAYMLKSFLQFNSAFEVVLFNSFIEYSQPNDLSEIIPMYSAGEGSSLWIRKTL